MGRFPKAQEDNHNMATSNDPIGNPPGAGRMNMTAKEAKNGGDENGVNRYGTLPTGYLLKAMNAHGGLSDATADKANISGISVK